MLATTEVWYPAFRRSDKERQRAYGHDDGQGVAHDAGFGGEDTEEHQDTDAHDEYAQAAREYVGAVALVPFTVFLNEFAFLVLIFLVFGSFLSIEEAHEGAVGHKRNNAVGFVVGELQSANPYEHDEDGQADEF